MKISGHYRLPVGRERAYQALQDPELLAQCMPGCESLDPVGNDTYKMRMKMILASMNGLFEGQVHIAEPNRPESFRLVVEGKGKIGFMKGDGQLRLAESDAGTEVAYEGDVAVGGTIAAVGNRLVDSTARMMIKKFFDKMAERVRPSGVAANA